MTAIRTKRISAGFSQEEVARRLDVTQGAVSQWEDGSCMPRADKLPELAKIFCCSVDELLKEEGVSHEKS
jgi:transcriptional regulator with XRE-family HTH domain